METESLLKKTPKRRSALKIVVALCGATLAAVALPRASHGGGLRASPTALKAEALKSGLVKDVDKSRWAPECLKWWQVLEAFPTSENPESIDAGVKYDVEVSDYDLISMPAGICMNTLYCAFENCAPGWWKVFERAAFDSAAAALGDFDVNVWGTDGLAKLEAIKAKVDPQGLFQCQKCVGFKGPVRDQ